MYHFLFNDTATTELYTLSLHDALPISRACMCAISTRRRSDRCRQRSRARAPMWLCWQTSSGFSLTSDASSGRSEEHTSELQSHVNLVCRLLLEKKKENRQRRKTKHRNK